MREGTLTQTLVKGLNFAKGFSVSLIKKNKSLTFLKTNRLFDVGD